MVNPNIQAPIPLSGRGLIDRNNGDYLSGEYRRLMDVEIDSDGSLISRRSVRPIYGTADNLDAVTTKMSNPYNYLGNYESFAVVWDKDYIRVISDYSSYSRYDWWSIAGMPVGSGANPAHYPVGFHRYNGINHMITYKNVVAGTEFHVYTDTFAGAHPSGTTFADFADNTVLPTTSSYGGTPKFIKSFVHKDRLWIVTDKTAFFSKPTDFLNFAAPDGGFFKFNEQTINDAIALKDSVYIICDSAVYVITYSSDPNIDAIVRKISDGIGGDSAAVYEDNIYFVKADILYSISNNSVIKTLDLSLNYLKLSDTTLSTKMVSFGDYLVFLRYRKYGYAVGGVLSPIPAQFNIINLLAVPPAESVPGLFFLNMTNGAVHGVTFGDKVEAASMWDRGYPIDIMVSPVESFDNEFYLHILTGASSWLDIPGVISAEGYTYVMARGRPLFSNDLPYDRLYNYTSQVPSNVNYNLDIEVASFVPDGNEYFFKKFRTLMFMGKLPADGCRVKYAFDNGAFTAGNVLDQLAVLDNPNARAPFPIRLPINQRAHSVSIKIDLESTAEVSDRQDISITDMRLLWTYSKRSVLTPANG